MNTDFKPWGRAANCGPMTNLPILICLKKNHRSRTSPIHIHNIYGHLTATTETEGLVAETTCLAKSRRYTTWHFTQMAKVWSSMYVRSKGMGEGSKRTVHR